MIDLGIWNVSGKAKTSSFISMGDPYNMQKDTNDNHDLRKTQTYSEQYDASSHPDGRT